MNENQQRLMRREAEKRLRDADVLERGLGLDETSDSPYLLRLLALELLLKLACAKHGVPHKAIRSASHRYHQLFGFLPEAVQQQLLEIAGVRIGPSGLKDARHLLEVWAGNFVRLRYPYEAYEDLTQEQYERLGEEWIEAGARLEDAKFAYYPEELSGFTHALLEMTSGAGDSPDSA